MRPHGKNSSLKLAELRTAQEAYRCGSRPSASPLSSCVAARRCQWPLQGTAGLLCLKKLGPKSFMVGVSASAHRLCVEPRHLRRSAAPRAFAFIFLVQCDDAWNAVMTLSHCHVCGFVLQTIEPRGRTAAGQRPIRNTSGRSKRPTCEALRLSWQSDARRQQMGENPERR